MPVKVLFVDLRNHRRIMNATTVNWTEGMQAKEAVENALGSEIFAVVENDLKGNSWSIGVAWHDKDVKNHSEMGGIKDFDWDVPDESVFFVVYEDNHTSQEERDLSSDWMIDNHKI